MKLIQRASVGIADFKTSWNGKFESSEPEIAETNERSRQRELIHDLSSDHLLLASFCYNVDDSDYQHCREGCGSLSRRLLLVGWRFLEAVVSRSRFSGTGLQQVFKWSPISFQQRFET
jgi:hypothetical protein